MDEHSPNSAKSLEEILSPHIEKVKGICNTYLKNLKNIQKCRDSAYLSAIESILGIVKEAVGGKCWRSYLAEKVYLMLGGNEAFPAVLTLLIESEHTASLNFDDIQDNIKRDDKTQFLDPTAKRRGEPTLYNKYGADNAISAALILLHYTPAILQEDEQLNDLLVKNKKNISDIISIINKHRSNISIGQAVDVYWHNNLPLENMDVSSYETMVEGKTGSLIKQAVELAAYLAGATDEQLEHLREFSYNLAQFYQKLDDYLDFVDSEKQGKVLYNDVKEGKMNYCIVKLINKINNEQFKENNMCDLKNKLEEKDGGAVKSLLKEYGILKDVKKDLDAHYKQALSCLKKLPENEHREHLESFLNSLYNRESLMVNVA